MTRILDNQDISRNIRHAQLAQNSADKMESMTENMEKLTQEMHEIAKQTREETISMKIMAFIALLFLPATFTSVCQCNLLSCLCLTDNVTDAHGYQIVPSSRYS